MADLTGRGIVCDERCGCPSPCPGGVACRCYVSTGIQSAAGEPVMEHKKCSCGEHCKCNPCNCVDTVSATAACKCGPACTCGPCAA